jgi:hypothetical protein
MISTSFLHNTKTQAPKMANRAKFKRGALVRIYGQPDSPDVTITRVKREEQVNDNNEMIIVYYYQCSWWDVKLNNFRRLDFDEDSLLKIKKLPRKNRYIDTP